MVNFILVVVWGLEEGLKEELFVLKVSLLSSFVGECDGWNEREIEGRPHLYSRRWPPNPYDAASSDVLDSTILSLFLDESDRHYAGE